MLGVPADQIAAARAAQAGDGPAGDGDLEIWPQNWPSLLLFREVEILIRPIFGFGISYYPGFDYAQVDVIMHRRGIEDPDGRMFADLMFMERAVLPVLNEAME